MTSARGTRISCTLSASLCPSNIATTAAPRPPRLFAFMTLPRCTVPPRIRIASGVCTRVQTRSGPPGRREDASHSGNARLVGILRGWTDGAYDGYVCDLAVDPGCQKQGIGRELLARLISHYGSQVQWVLRASKIAARYYEHLGWQAIENGWSWARESWK